MPATRRSTQQKHKPDGSKPKTKPSKAAKAQRAGAAVKSAQARGPSADSLKKTIAYFYLLSFCPPERIADWARATASMRKALAESTGLSELAYYEMVTPEVCRRMVSFHQASREPSQERVESLVQAAQAATNSPKKAEAFQQEMTKVAQLPQRASPEGRLHRKKGCQFCKFPCSYGYFTLISDPEFRLLQDLFAAEARKPAAEQNPWTPCVRFTRSHLQGLAGMAADFIEPGHLLNLSYCLLMLSTAKSRLPSPEQQLRLLQATGQEFIRDTLARNRPEWS